MKISRFFFFSREIENVKNCRRQITRVFQLCFEWCILDKGLRSLSAVDLFYFGNPFTLTYKKASCATPCSCDVIAPSGFRTTSTCFSPLLLLFFNHIFIGVFFPIKKTFLLNHRELRRIVLYCMSIYIAVPLYHINTNYILRTSGVFSHWVAQKTENFPSHWLSWDVVGRCNSVKRHWKHTGTVGGKIQHQKKRQKGTVMCQRMRLDVFIHPLHSEGDLRHHPRGLVLTQRRKWCTKASPWLAFMDTIVTFVGKKNVYFVQRRRVGIVFLSHSLQK